MSDNPRVHLVVTRDAKVTDCPFTEGQIVVSADESAMLYDILGRRMRPDMPIWEEAPIIPQSVRTSDGKTLTTKDGKILEVQHV